MKIWTSHVMTPILGLSAYLTLFYRPRLLGFRSESCSDSPFTYSVLINKLSNDFHLSELLHRGVRRRGLRRARHFVALSTPEAELRPLLDSGLFSVLVVLRKRPHRSGVETDGPQRIPGMLGSRLLAAEVSLVR